MLAHTLAVKCSLVAAASLLLPSSGNWDIQIYSKPGKDSPHTGNGGITNVGYLPTKQKRTFRRVAVK